MAKTGKSKPARTREQRAAMWRAILIHSVAAGLFIAIWAAGLWTLRRHVATRLAMPPEPPRVVLKNRPVWMSDYLADQIAALVRPRGTHSAMDRQLLRDAVLQLSQNPWIRQVNRVARRYGSGPGDTLEIDCEYRAPLALVASAGQYWLVDGEGVKLPESFSDEELDRIQYGRDGKVNIRIIQGVRSVPPLEGKQWSGADLAAGLDMVKLLYGRDFADEILRVDVSNFDRSKVREPQIVLVTRYGTQIRWGEPPATRFGVEIPSSVKLARLAAIKEQYGRVDAHRSWLDIRFEYVTYPIEEAPIVHAEHRR